MSRTFRTFTQLCLTLTPLLATSPLEAAESAQRFDIPAQPLADALLQFSEESGVKVFFSADKARHLGSSGVNGRHTQAEALGLLLAESGMQYRYTDAGAVTIEPKAAGSAKSSVAGGPETLPAVQVTAPAGGYDITNPYNKDYAVPNTAVATRTDTPIIDTPASIQVVPRSVLQDQQAISLADGLKNVSGVQLSTSPTYDNFVVRGFDVNSGIYRNGIRESSWAAETANVEHLEVLKGPAAILYGRIEPGGMISRTTKKPLDTPYYSLQQQFGSFDMYRTTADATGPLTKDGTLAYRFNLAYQNNKSYRDLLMRDRIFIAPQLSWKPSDRTQFGIGMEYQRDDFTWDEGFPVRDGATRPVDLPINRALSDPQSKSNQERQVVDFNWSHAFNNDWKISQQFSAFLGGRNQLELFPYGFHPDQRVVDRYLWRNNVLDDNTYSFNTNLVGHLDTWGVKHTLLAGHDFYQRDNKSVWGCCSQLDSIDINNPQPYPGKFPADPDNYSLGRESWNGVYFQDQMVFWDKLHILGGGRYDWASLSSGGSAQSFAGAENDLSQKGRDQGKFSPRVGVLYRALPWLSVYANFTESLGSNNGGKGIDGRPIKPQEATQYEGGFKTEFFGGRLNSTLAFFSVTKNNIAVKPAAFLQYVIPIGKARSTGIEWDVTGNLTENWSVIGNYALTNTEVIEDTTLGLKGKRFPNAPKHSANLWTKYDFNDEPLLKGFSLGTGMRVVSQRQGDPQNSFQLPGYFTWDALAAYSFKVGATKMTAQFNAYNLLDKRYFSGADTFDASQRFYGNIPGAPRSFMGSIRLEY